MYLNSTNIILGCRLILHNEFIPYIDRKSVAYQLIITLLINEAEKKKGNKMWCKMAVDGRRPTNCAILQRSNQVKLTDWRTTKTI